MANQDRKLLDLCQGAPCMLEFGTPCGIHPSVPCHSDMLRHGRGAYHKSNAIFAVPGCPDCHAKFTRGNLGRDGYEAIWLAAHEKWLVYLWNEKLIEVTK